MSLMTVSSASADDLTMFRGTRAARCEVGVEHQLGHADDAVHRRADFVAHVRQKLALGPVGRLGFVAGDGQLQFAAQGGGLEFELHGHRFATLNIGVQPGLTAVAPSPCQAGSLRNRATRAGPEQTNEVQFGGIKIHPHYAV